MIIYTNNKVYFYKNNVYKEIFTFNEYNNSIKNILHYDNNKCCIIEDTSEYKTYENVDNIGINMFTSKEYIFNYEGKIQFNYDPNVIGFSMRYNNKLEFIPIYSIMKFKNKKFKYIGYNNYYLELNSNKYYYYNLTNLYPVDHNIIDIYNKNNNIKSAIL